MPSGGLAGGGGFGQRHGFCPRVVVGHEGMSLGIPLPPLSAKPSGLACLWGDKPILERSWHVQPLSELGHSMQGVGLSLALPPPTLYTSPAPHPRPAPMVLSLQEPSLWKARVVLTGASLWYLKREYPLYVHFINGECTGETLICVSN